jgi:hypothetical protein
MVSWPPLIYSTGQIGSQVVVMTTQPTAMLLAQIATAWLPPASSVHDVAEILGAVSWPLVVLFIAVMFRKPLASLIGNIRELKWRDFRLRFARELQQVHEIATTTGALPPVPLEEEELAGVAVDTSTLDLAQRSPRAVVLEAWAKVESASRTLVKEQVPGFDQSRPSSARVGDVLVSAGLLDDARARVFTILRNLRNRAAHEEDFALTAADAVDYAGLATRLAAALGEAAHRHQGRETDATEQ